MRINTASASKCSVHTGCGEIIIASKFLNAVLLMSRIEEPTRGIQKTEMASLKKYENGL